MYSEKSTSLIVRLKDASDAKLTVDGRSFHTFTTLSAKKSTCSSKATGWMEIFQRACALHENTRAPIANIIRECRRVRIQPSVRRHCVRHTSERGTMTTYADDTYLVVPAVTPASMNYFASNLARAIISCHRTRPKFNTCFTC